MRASLAVALREYNARPIRCKIRATIFTNPIGGVIVAAVYFKFHLSLLQKLACAIVAAPLLCIAAKNAAHQKGPEVSPSVGAFDAHVDEKTRPAQIQNQQDRRKHRCDRRNPHCRPRHIQVVK